MTDRRLIEDYLPIREISAEAAREKSIRHGHISTLHLWWARRLLAARHPMRIEFKSRATAGNVALTRNEWIKVGRFEADYWLYIVQAEAWQRYAQTVEVTL